MEVKIEAGKLIISLPISERPSKSGKTLVVASSNGNIQTSLIHKDKPVTIGVNAYISR
uniref:Uncharacterized protein n=1 Tax=viral metagenome TaxID=1070528 RepID=A0A6M3MDJ8_9ZZZZ